MLKKNVKKKMLKKNVQKKIVAHADSQVKDDQCSNRRFILHHLLLNNNSSTLLIPFSNLKKQKLFKAFSNLKKVSFKFKLFKLL